MDAASQIKDFTSKAGKTYAFDEKHNHRIPSLMWFQESFEGTVLFIVFYTQACRYSKCRNCNLPSLCSAEHISSKDIRAQIRWVMAQPEVQSKKDQIQKVILSNNGSVLDEETFASGALVQFVNLMNDNFPNVKILSLETRAQYVDEPELEFLRRTIAEGETPTIPELAVGFEAFDSYIRNNRFRKGLSLKTFERVVRMCAKYGFRLKAYFMQKPVTMMTDEAAIMDIQNAIDYLDKQAVEHDVEINMHLNPTFVARGTPLAKSFARGRYYPPLLTDVAKAALHAENLKPTIYLGLFDEGMAVEGGSFIRPGDEEIVKKLEKFNRTQDYGILKRILGRRQS
ncbi:MAG: hypothetical protein ACYTBZ_07390 [Planctomycetota bacterium]